MKFFLGLLLGCVSCTLSLGQEAAGRDSLVLQLNQELSDLKNLKISGYLQAQFQLAPRHRLDVRETLYAQALEQALGVRALERLDGHGTDSNAMRD